MQAVRWVYHYKMTYVASRGLGIVLAFGFLCMQGAVADSFSRPALSSDAVVETSTLIIEGEVVDAVCNGKDCFNSLYKVKVHDLLKGGANIGDLLSVGETRSYLEVEVGKKYMFFLQEISDEYLAECREKKLLEADIYADSPIFVSRYDILEDGKVSVIRCDDELKVLELSDGSYRKEMLLNSAGCIKYTADIEVFYDVVVKALNKKGDVLTKKVTYLFKAQPATPAGLFTFSHPSQMPRH